MESVEKTFLSELEQDQKKLKSLFSSAGAYDCPCRRKNMSNSQWQDYKNGYLQKVWKLLHERAFKYLDNPSQETKNKVFKFFNEDVKRIPCYTCRKHYTEYTKDNDLKKACDSRMSLCKFLIDLHNAVNKNTKKPEMSYEDVFKLYGYNYIEKQVVYRYPIKKEYLKQEPVKLEPVKSEPIKLEPVKLEPIKLEPVKLEPVKSEPVSNIDKMRYFNELNNSISKQIYLENAGNNNVHTNRNNIIKNSMNSIIKRGRW